MFNKILKTLIALIILAGIAFGGYYLYTNYYVKNVEGLPTRGNTSTNSSFVPFGRNTVDTSSGTKGGQGTTTVVVDKPAQKEVRILNKIYASPIGGFVATSTTASSTAVRFVDRGTGHVYELDNRTDVLRKISATTIPRVYESFWGPKADKAIFRYMKDGSDDITSFYTELIALKASTTEKLYEIQGKFITQGIAEIALSPKGDKVFEFEVIDGKGVGSISTLDEKSKVKIFETPMTQVNVEWPEENTISLTTKGTATQSGFTYFFDIKRGSWKKILGPVQGLSTKTSHDGKILLATKTKDSTIASYIYNVKGETSDQAVFRTLSDKCVWGKLHQEDLYCGIPTEIPVGTYPDDWYKGKVTFSDQIWHLDAVTGEVHLIAKLLPLSKERIDAIELQLDPKEETLYFINKNDLSFWSLDLTSSN